MIEGARAGRAAAAVAVTVAMFAGCGGSDVSTRGQVVTQSVKASLTRAQVDAAVAALPGLAGLIGGPAACEVTLRQATYRTVDPQGREAVAGMGLLVPSGCPGPYPVLVYHHGTQILKSSTMSDPANLEVFLAYGYFASQGYAVVMPDYLGYGESSLGYHPYLDAENMGRTSIDALRAGMRMLADLGVATSGKLFLTGYSQGGHSTLATQRALERDHAAEFAVTASAPMAGFYSLSTTFADAVTAPTDLGSVLFAFGLTALQKNYGDVYASASAAFRSPWASTVESLLPGSADLATLLGTGALPVALTGPTGLLTPAMAEAIAGDAGSPVRRRLVQNDVIDWTPRAPITLCHGGRDTVVPVKNMSLAQASFRSRNAPTTAIDIETIPAFKAAIDAQIAAAGTLLVYHGQIAPPLCFSVVKNQVFDPRR
ncbi:MAG: hypothetical protein RJA99_1626 [Pseudomonadota bacterium]